MDYDDWVKDFEQVQSRYLMADADESETGREMDRLRVLLPITEPAERHEWGEAELASLANAMTPEAVDRRLRAEIAYRKGMSSTGSFAERREALVKALQEIEKIADETDDWDEKRQITGSAGALASEISDIDFLAR